MLQNANTGGENVHRGSCLGTVAGAITGYDSLPPHLLHGLYNHDEISKEIDNFIDALLSSRVNSCDYREHQ
jgi:ADP-ribosyl-[dinitrogen reductase] hydrolase